MVAEGFPFVGALSPATFDPWSSRNMNLSPDGGVTPAPRRSGAIDGDQRRLPERHALRRRHRHPGDRLAALPRGRSSTCTTATSRSPRGSGSSAATTSDNQVIWFTDARPAIAFDQTPEAFEVIDEWMANIKANPVEGRGGQQAAARGRPLLRHAGPARSRPATTSGTASSTTKPPGACTQVFPIYSSSRRVAGGPFEGGIFKCGLQSVDAAIAAGDYGSWVPSAAERDRLMQIFPDRRVRLEQARRGTSVARGVSHASPSSICDARRATPTSRGRRRWPRARRGS